MLFRKNKSKAKEKRRERKREGERGTVSMILEDIKVNSYIKEIGCSIVVLAVTAKVAVATVVHFCEGLRVAKYYLLR